MVRVGTLPGQGKCSFHVRTVQYGKQGKKLAFKNAKKPLLPHANVKNVTNIWFWLLIFHYTVLWLVLIIAKLLTKSRILWGNPHACGGLSYFN